VVNAWVSWVVIDLCGIFYTSFDPGQQTVNEMIKSLRARGPDHYGVVKLDDGQTFGHTRLSIIDVNERSNQPMQLHDCIIIFNGEIFNYKKIRDDLKDFPFQTQSDTEVIIALYKRFGVDGFKALQGQFAFALYDIKTQEMFYLRDPIGIKPLYFSMRDGKIIVASKLSTIRKNIKSGKNVRALNDILAFGYPRIPVYEDIYEIVPGRLYDKNMNNKKIEFNIDKKKTFKQAIKEQFLVSDRPVGITLSGGVDSGYIAYVCSKLSKQPIHTFTIGFSKDDPDIVFSRELANLIKSEHHEIIISKNVLQNELMEGLDKMEFPSDLGSVALTNILGKEIAKTNIKVILIGEGADETQGGYRRYKEKIGLRTDELWEWYITRITKNDFEARKKILGDDVMGIVVADNNLNNANKILMHDLKNEILYYHLKRIDHIISDFGIEARVPYLDYSVVMNTFDKPFMQKVNSSGDKLLLRRFASDDGLPEKFAFRPKVALKEKGFSAAEHLQKIVKRFMDD
jgi:asparagine synthase (glutamine-hydrolysing)